MNELLSVSFDQYCLMAVVVILYVKFLGGFKRAWDKFKNSRNM